MIVVQKLNGGFVVTNNFVKLSAICEYSWPKIVFSLMAVEPDLV